MYEEKIIINAANQEQELLQSELHAFHWVSWVKL